jgi:protein-S-isoprenylcysteine O-methyltransferase Ste14
MNSTWRVILLVALWVAWLLPFFILSRKQRGEAVQKDTRARWGIVIESLGYAVVFMHRPQTWTAPLAWWRVVPGVGIGLLGIWLSWTALAHLGRQWRVDAGLNADHELVRGGPYRLVRHPIYASMFCMWLAAAALIGTFPRVPVGLVLFIVGTEIRVRTEDSLLASRFGEQFRAWQRTVPAYIPFVR